MITDQQISELAHEGRTTGSQVMLALKAQWAVYAAIIPGQDMQKYTQAWSYTSADYEADGNTRGLLYQDTAARAYDYARSLEMAGLNVVRLEYIWL